MTATATAHNYEDLALKVVQMLNSNSVSKVEADLGVNRRYLYDLKSGRIDAFPANDWRKIQDYFTKEVEARNAWSVASTKNLDIALGTFKKAQSQKLCLALTGKTGFGKTESAKLFHHKMSGVVYVHCNTEMTKSGFLDGICMDLGIAPQHRGNAVEGKIKSIIRAILKLENPLFIIDDAGKLRDSAFRMFQILFDEAAGRVGFVLMGVPEFKQKVFKNADRGVFCYKEIARRIGWVTMGDIYRQDVTDICLKNSITDESAISYLCDNVGDFDTLKRLIKAAKTACKNGEVIDRTFFSQSVGAAVENYRVSYVVNS